MLSNFYLKIPRKVRILIIFLVIITLCYFVIRFFFVQARNVPPDFLKARQEAASIALVIVGMSDQSATNIDKISELDAEKKYREALTLVTDEIQRNNEARQKAIELSNQLEVMANNLSGIYPASSAQVALQAVSSETTLISRLITYNDYLNQLLNVLRRKFAGQVDGDEVPQLVQKINNEAQAINDLNREFNDQMKIFDNAR